MANVKLSEVRRALPLAKALVRKLDVDKDKRVSGDEVKRIKVRDNYVARNAISDAMDRLSWPDNPGPYGIDSVNAELDGAIRSLERADKNKDGQLTPAELATVSRAGKAFVKFAQLYKGKTVSAFKVAPYEKPGTKAWVELAKREYFGGPNEPMNKPYFGTALRLKLSELPNTKLKTAFTKLGTDFPGRAVEAEALKVNGATVYFMHAYNAERYDVRLFDAAGKQIAIGNVTPRPGKPREDWVVRWT
jgi:hypothetical protein